MAELDIGEVARRSGCPPSTLRYYEAEGLIRSTGRHGLRRVFDDRVLQQLALITLGREAGFSLKEIAGMFAPDGDVSVDREKCLAKADELDRLAKRLASMSKILRHTAACPAPSHLECPSFRRYMNIVERRARSPGTRAVQRGAPRKRTG